MPMTVDASYKDDRLKWNLAWEQKLAGIYGTSLVPKYTGWGSLSVIGDTPRLRSFLESSYKIDSETSARNLMTMRRELIVLQRDLTVKLAEKMAENNFEEKWNACPSTVQKKWILEGLVRTCEACEDFEGRREYCPEITINRLGRDRGEGLLSLMKNLMLNDVDEAVIPSDFSSLPCEAFECSLQGYDQLETRAQKFYKSSVRISRMYFLVMFAWNVLLAFHGDSEDYRVSKPASETKKGMQEFWDAARKSGYTRDETQELRQMGRQRVSHLNEIAQRACTSCGKPEARQDGVVHVKLTACSRCNMIGRKVLYCSKVCQTQDWKHGNPPHKSVCGKENAFSEAVLMPPSPPAANNKATKWPAPEPGIKRTPALQHQLKMLTERPNFDYVFIPPMPEPENIGLCLKSDAFRQAFEDAVRTHSLSSVRAMFIELLPLAIRHPKFNPALLRAQLEREFEVNLNG
ncbi:hypothetical protein DL96DRAFT_1582060 [Flagelloscypha sp. PMI_526]|nr:hypothetical protein DL96DRAFT_1582060 [Flagelloscypha sp. PMI_526]